MLVGSFSHLTRVDDDFICMLIKKAAEKPNAKEIIGGLWAFSEVADYQGWYKFILFLLCCCLLNAVQKSDPTSVF